MQAIDKEPTFDLVGGLGELSILDDSFLDKMDQEFKTQSWSNGLLDADQPIVNGPMRTKPVQTSPPDDGELWQALMLEQRTRYEDQVSKLKKDINDLRKVVRDSSSPNSTEDKKRPYNDKWKRFNRILGAYFEEYNVRI